MDMKLQEQIVVEICKIINGAWDQIHLHYEDSIVEDARRTVYKAFYFSNGEKSQFGLNAKSIQLLFELGDNKQESSGGPWTWFDLNIDNTGRYAFDFEYGMPPLLKAEIDLLNEYSEED